jgi:uncharacterized Tic20 family protein
LIWQLKKDEIPALDAHGKMVANWMISSFDLRNRQLVLCIVLIGILRSFSARNYERRFSDYRRNQSQQRRTLGISADD